MLTFVRTIGRCPNIAQSALRSVNRPPTTELKPGITQAFVKTGEKYEWTGRRSRDTAHHHVGYPPSYRSRQRWNRMDVLIPAKKPHDPHDYRHTKPYAHIARPELPPDNGVNCEDNAKSICTVPLPLGQRSTSSSHPPLRALLYSRGSYL